jgi:predicted dehydrogenase
MSIRVALVGYGYSGKTFHAPLIQAVSELELVVVGSSSAEKVRADLPAVRVISDPLEAVTARGVDLVVIATPNATHAALARAAIDAGKHVVVDKPFVLTLTDARRLEALATEKERVLSVFQNRRWDADFLGAKAAIEGGALGDVVHFESHFDRFRPAVRDRWREQAVPGGGILYDLGPHLVDQALQLFGSPLAVSACAATQRPGAHIDDWLDIVLDYGRLQVILHASMLVAGGATRLALHGTRGSWIKRSADVQEQQLLAGVRPGSAGWGVDPQPATFYDGATSRDVSVPSGDYRSYYFALRDAIRGGAKNPVTPAQAVAVTGVLELVSESSRLGRRLCVSRGENLAGEAASSAG